MSYEGRGKKRKPLLQCKAYTKNFQHSKKKQYGIMERVKQSFV